MYFFFRFEPPVLRVLCGGEVVAVISQPTLRLRRFVTLRFDGQLRVVRLLLLLEFLEPLLAGDRKSTRLNSSHDQISYAVFCLKKKKNILELCDSCVRH